MHDLLIQPTARELDTYHAYATDNTLGFEVADFAFPAVLDGDTRSVIERYKTLEDPGRLVSAHVLYPLDH